MHVALVPTEPDGTARLNQEEFGELWSLPGHVASSVHFAPAACYDAKTRRWDAADHADHRISAGAGGAGGHGSTRAPSGGGKSDGNSTPADVAEGLPPVAGSRSWSCRPQRQSPSAYGAGRQRPL